MLRNHIAETLFSTNWFNESAIYMNVWAKIDVNFPNVGKDRCQLPKYGAMLLKISVLYFKEVFAAPKLEYVVPKSICIITYIKYVLHVNYK